MADDIRKTIPQLNAGGVVSGSLFESAQPAQTSTGYASVKVTSDDIAAYTNSTKSYSALNTSAKQIIPAINEAASMGGVVQLTQAEYTGLSTAEKMNGSIYKITDNAKMYCLDEEYHPVKELTTAQYEALTTAEKNNGTIYIQTDAETTASDIPVASGETETIAEAIEALNAVTSGSLTLDSTYIKTAEINRWVKKGNVVEFWLTATVNTAWTANNIFASGLPAPLGTGRMLGLDTSSNVPLRIQMTANGSIANAYSATAPVSNHIIEVHGTYIAGG